MTINCRLSKPFDVGPCAEKEAVMYNNEHIMQSDI